MSSKVKIKLNRPGVRELLQSPEMEALLGSLAGAARSRLGDGYESDTYIGKNRVNASIRATTYKARKENLETNSLLKALGGGK